MRFLFQFFLVATILFGMPTDAEAQFGNLKNKLKKGLNLKNKKKAETETNSSESDNSGSTRSSRSSRSTSTRSTGSSSTENAPPQEVVAEPLARESVETEGVSSTVHEKYQNKIVFSNAPIKKRRENETAFVTTAKLGEPIYYRIYMDNSLYNYLRNEPGTKDASVGGLKSRSSYKLSLLLNDKVIVEDKRYYPDLPSDFKEKKTTFDGALTSKNPQFPYEGAFPNTVFGKEWMNRYNEKTSIGILQFQKFLTKAEHLLTKGEHKLTLQIQPMYSYRNKDLTYAPEIFSGDLTLIVGDKVADPKNPELCLPMGELSKDAALTQKIKQAYKSKVGTLKRDLSISSDEWTIKRHELTGFILHRWIAVTIGGDGEDGCFYQTHIFQQDYDGTGYGKLYVDRTIEEPFAVPCSCLVDEY
ncbi:MAG: hypothetical protein AB8B69_26005 [Chitinophagales bacterium]